MGSQARGVGARPPRLEVSLLGTVEVILDGARLGAFTAVRLQRFLALVTLRHDLQHRSRLAFELWPDSDERQARTNLRKLVHDVRQSLPDIAEFIEIDNEVVRWRPEGSSVVDVLRFRDALAAGNLELAGRLYTGDLLPACYDDWVLDEREKLRREAHGALLRLARDAEQRGEAADTIRHARRVIEIEPTDEAAVLLQMDAHAALGDRAAALRTYHRCTNVLARELGVEPGAALSARYEDLRAGRPSADPTVSAGRTTPVDSPFVGRDAELGFLTRAFATAGEGQAHLLLLSGEPGIGKSRLARELARRVRADGHLVVSARAYEAAGRPSWGPVVDLLRSEPIRSHIDALDHVWRLELARLLPELDAGPATSASGRSGEPAQRHRLLDAVSRAIVADDRPRLVVVDDLQWCDAETIESIGFLIRSRPVAPVLVVGTVRVDELDDDHPLHALTDALMRDRAVSSVALERLDKESTATLATRLGPAAAVDPDLIERLWEETEGNPLFVIEALRAGIAPGDGEPILTPTMRAVLRSRFVQLSEAARRVAEVAAVIGRSFTAELVVAATGGDEDDVVDQIDELWRLRIIRDHGSAYDFTHDKLRAVALEMMSPARRRRLHRAVAESIATASRDVAAVSSQLAAHYDQAGLYEPAIEAYWAAGAQAVSVSALDDAVTLFRRALALLADRPGTPERNELELQLRIALGSPLVALEGYGSRDAHQLYERAYALSRRLNRPVDPPILRGLGLARLQGCRFDDCRELGQALVDRDEVDSVTLTEGRYLLGVSDFWRGDLAGARRHLESALESYDPSRREEHLAAYAQDPKAVCLVRLALVELWAGDPARADELARAALEDAADHDHVMTLNYVLTYASVVAAESEDTERLAGLLRDAAQLWERLPMRYLRIVVEALGGWLDVRNGSAEGVEVIVGSVERSRAEGETLHLTYCLLLLARARELNDEFDKGRVATREALAWSRAKAQGYLVPELLRLDGELAHRCGDADAAEQSLRQAVESAGRQGADWLELRALTSVVGRTPDSDMREHLGDLVETLPSGRELPPFRAAMSLLTTS